MKNDECESFRLFEKWQSWYGIKSSWWKHAVKSKQSYYDNWLLCIEKLKICFPRQNSTLIIIVDKFFDRPIALVNIIILAEFSKVVFSAHLNFFNLEKNIDSILDTLVN